MSIILRIGAVRGNAYADSVQSGQDAASSDTDAHDIPAPEEIRPAPTYPGCFGLPYQDHNYGQQPPMSPPPPRSPTPPPPAVSMPAELEEETPKVPVPTVSKEEEVVEDSITRCICGFLHDDGFMICCDKCSVWQHIDCMNIDRNNIPDNYCCEICEPRPLDFERARQIQLRRREELASLGRKPVPPKPKGSRQRRVGKAGSRMLKAGKFAKSHQLKRDKKLKTKKEKENMKEAFKKQKLGKSGVAKQKKLKKKLNQLQTQNEVDPWSASSPLFSIGEAKENEYSPEVQEFLSRAKTNGIHAPHVIGVYPEELMVRLYQVVDVKKNCKGLEATDMIAPGRAVIDYKGKVMLQQHYKPDPFRSQSETYVLQYSKFEGLDLCIDASAFEGDARFIRRSCIPNAEMCHIIDNGKLLFIVQAKKEIAKGSEITIPFDFNYTESSYIECACGRVSCPVSRYWKKVRSAQKSPDKPKRKRQASGEGRVRRNSVSKSSPIKSGKSSPIKTSPVKSPVSVTPLSFSVDEPMVSVDSTPNEDIQVSSPVKSGSMSRRASKAGSDIKEEEKPCKASTATKPAHSDCPFSSVTSTATRLSESEAESSTDCPKKLTREEKKIQDLMKYFEKMDKREERRKEAQARMDHKKHRGESTDCSECTTVASDLLSQSLPSIQFPDVDNKIVIKLEDPPSADSPQKNRHIKKTKRKRRSSRVMSALEPLCSSPQQPPPPKRITMMPAETAPPPVEEIKVKEEPIESYQPTSYSAPNTASIDFESPSLHADSYIFHKKKKHLVSERTTSRSSDGRTESTDTQDGEEEMFVAYNETPRNTMEHFQRRNSTSAAFGRPSDSSKGNAKKRWLRQAMHETPISVEVPSPTGSMSPLHPTTPTATVSATSAVPPSLPSPTISPSDYATPLKKRRVAPEFLPSISSAAGFSQSNGEHLVSSAPPAEAQPAATSTVSVTPTSINTRQCLNTTYRLPRKASLFGTNCNGLVSTESEDMSALSNGSGPSVSSCVSTENQVPATASNQGELSMDGLSSSVCPEPSCSASAGHSAAARVLADSECNSLSVGEGASSSSQAVCVEHDSGIEIPLVDSSGAVMDPDLREAAHQRVRGSDSVSVCSSDNEAAAPVVQGADMDRPQESHGQSAQVVAESSSAFVSGGSRQMEDDDADVSESQQVEEPMEVEDEGNEVSGSTSEAEESSNHAGTSTGSSQLSTDCQVNSSQDCAGTSRQAVVDSSPSQGEAECNNSSESVPGTSRTCNHVDSAGSSVTRQQDAGVAETDRGCVSSAQDITSGSFPTSAQDCETSAVSDMECGPSSSTQTSRSRSNRTAVNLTEDSVCNSSSVDYSVPFMFFPDDADVDSTTQNSRSHRDRVDSQHSALGGEEACCDSNTDDQALYNALSAECVGVSSSSRGDSQGSNVADSGISVAAASSSMVSSSVTSSLSSCSHTDSAAFVSSLVTHTATSSRSSSETADLPGPSQSTCNSSPNVVNSCRAVDSASAEPSVLPASSAHDMDSRELDGVGSSATPRSSNWQCDSEASTSSQGRRLSDDGDPSTRPGSSGLLFKDMDSAVSSAACGLDGPGDRMMTNGDLTSSMSVSSISEDSCGSNSTSNPSTAVSSSEAQAAPSISKRKVSLSEYRSRRKEKCYVATCTCSSTSPKSSVLDSHRSSCRSALDINISLEPLPLFEPITIRDAREAEEKREKLPMSLTDRLRIEFGLETGTSEDDDRGNSSAGFRKCAKDIPPPPPPPPNGVVGGVRRPSSTLAKASSTENDEESRQGSVPGKSPSATVTSNMASCSVPVNGSSNHPSQGPGFAYLAKLHSAGVTKAGAVTTPTAPLPSPTGLFGPAAGNTQQHSLYTNGSVRPTGMPLLMNGSHPPAPAATFPSGAMFPQPPQASAQPQAFSPALKAQQAPPPPPPPSTAYPFVAQSRTHSHHPQQTSRERSSSLTQQHSALGAPSLSGSRSGRVRHSSGDSSSNHPQGRFHYHSQDRLKHKSPYSDRKKH